MREHEASVWVRVGWKCLIEADVCSETSEEWRTVMLAYAEYGQGVFNKLAAKYQRVDAVEIEDAVQEAMLRYYRALKAGKTIHAPPGWLLVVAHHALHDAAKTDHRRSRVDLDEAVYEVDEAAGTVEDVCRRIVHHERFDEAMAHLDTLVSPFQARCFRLRMTNAALKEIAAAERRPLQRVAEAVAYTTRVLQAFVTEGT